MDQIVLKAALVKFRSEHGMNPAEFDNFMGLSRGTTDSAILATITPHGSLSEGTETHLGIIEDVSLTAYFIAGRWVPFTTIHGAYEMATPLVTFTGSF